MTKRKGEGPGPNGCKPKCEALAFLNEYQRTDHEHVRHRRP